MAIAMRAAPRTQKNLELSTLRSTLMGMPDDASFEAALQGEIQPRAKRTRRDFSSLGKQFIAQYLDTYISLSGNAAGRSRLIDGILETSTCLLQGVSLTRLAPIVKWT